MYTRMGTSVQINDILVWRVKLLHEMHMKGNDISKKVRGVNKIVESNLKKLKLGTQYGILALHIVLWILQGIFRMLNYIVPNNTFFFEVDV